MIYTEYKSYNIQNIEYTDEQIKDILANKVKQYELNFLKNKGMKIIDKEIEYMTINNEVKATIKYTIEGNIGKSKEIIVK